MTEYEAFASHFKVPGELYFVEQRGKHFVRGAFAQDPSMHVALCRLAIDFDKKWDAWQACARWKEETAALAASLAPVVEDQPIGLRATLRGALDALESARGNINPERGFADVVEAEIEDAIEAAREELEKNP